MTASIWYALIYRSPFVSKLAGFSLTTFGAVTMGGLNREPKNDNKAKRMKGPLLDVSDLADVWDSFPEIRERLRDDGCILHKNSSAGEDIPTCVLNKELLQPLLARMALLEHRPIFPVEKAEEQLSILLAKNKRAMPEGDGSITKATWHLRKLLGFVKMKVRRSEVSKDSQLEGQQILSYLVWWCAHLRFHFWTSLISCPVRSIFPAKDEDFQQLCLVLDPNLQEHGPPKQRKNEGSTWLNKHYRLCLWMYLVKNKAK